MHRILCLLFCLSVAAAPTALSQTAKATDALTAGEKLSRDIFRELIEINTTVSRGSTKAADAMAARLKNAGYPDGDITLAGPHPDHMNMVARLRGKGAHRPVLFIGHLDVVEALKADWSLDPFSFTERDGYFYGRGTNDMKCEDADIVANLIRLKREGFVPDRDIIVALTEDEESGDANGVSWLLENRRSLIDAEFCINLEGGGGDIKNGRHVMMEVQTGEKVYISYRLEAKNPGGHSSLPVKENAIYRLAAALSRLSGHDFPVRLNETTRLFFERGASQETGPTRADMQAMAKTPLDTGAAERLSAASPYYNAMLRTTCVATMLQGGHAENALPQSATATVNCRLLPEHTPEGVLSALRTVVADDQVAVRLLHASALSPLSPLRNDVVAAVEEITATMWPGVVVTPVMSTGATDGRLLRRAGIPVYGVSGMFTDADDVRAHGRDERLGVSAFEEGVEFMYRLMKSLSR
jgi:acetylornithine deacetylase/succinyl-diaminopimelate desuccinylase-like protein